MKCPWCAKWLWPWNSTAHVLGHLDLTKFGKAMTAGLCEFSRVMGLPDVAKPRPEDLMSAKVTKIEVLP